MADTRLLAYIPVVNQRYIRWLERYPHSTLYLIETDVAQKLLPRLLRDMGAVDAGSVRKMIESLGLVREVWFSHMATPQFTFTEWPIEWVLPDEDISQAFAHEFLEKSGVRFRFENISARWDMTAVKRQQPIMPDVEQSIAEIDCLRIEETDRIAERSPDWWRQIGIMAFREEKLLGVGRNEHFPTEYETDIFGDPRILFDAGDPAGAEVYLSLHAEEYLAGYCSRNGISLKGASIYINTFPCGRCARMLSICGIKELFFREGSSFLKGFEILRDAGIRIVQVKTPEPA
jgi:dCMP deaminase